MPRHFHTVLHHFFLRKVLELSVFYFISSFYKIRYKISLTPNYQSTFLVAFPIYFPRHGFVSLFLVSPLRHGRAHRARGGEGSTAERSLPRADDEAPWSEMFYRGKLLKTGWW